MTKEKRPFEKQIERTVFAWDIGTNFVSLEIPLFQKQGQHEEANRDKTIVPGFKSCSCNSKKT
jgi:hypothetical protein